MVNIKGYCFQDRTTATQCNQCTSKWLEVHVRFWPCSLLMAGYIGLEAVAWPETLEEIRSVLKTKGIL